MIFNDLLGILPPILPGIHRLSYAKGSSFPSPSCTSRPPGALRSSVSVKRRCSPNPAVDGEICDRQPHELPHVQTTPILSERTCKFPQFIFRISQLYRFSDCHYPCGSPTFFVTDGVFKSRLSQIQLFFGAVCHSLLLPFSLFLIIAIRRATFRVPIWGGFVSVAASVNIGCC